MAMANGELHPEGYNFGLLCLIPKKGTLPPSDTRPISVTNADNRIVAKAVVTSHSLTLYNHLHPAQKGFVPWRVFEELLHQINELF